VNEGDGADSVAFTAPAARRWPEPEFPARATSRVIGLDSADSMSETSDQGTLGPMARATRLVLGSNAKRIEPARVRSGITCAAGRGRPAGRLCDAGARLRRMTMTELNAGKRRAALSPRMASSTGCTSVVELPDDLEKSRTLPVCCSSVPGARRCVRRPYRASSPA